MDRPKREKKERVPGMELEESDITDAILDSAQAITGVLLFTSIYDTQKYRIIRVIL
jgi:hypothetical protein